MRLIYLGMPRCGSSWLHEAIHMNANIADMGDTKESELFLSNPQMAKSMMIDDMMDFSTNNWSMDSWVATEIMPQIKYKIMIHRNAKDVVSSYHSIVLGRWEDWQISCLSNRIADSGDVIERWLHLIGDDLLLYEYEDLVRDPGGFAKMIMGDIGINCTKIPEGIRNASASEKPVIDHDVLLKRIETQEQKYESLKQMANYRRLNFHASN